VAPTSRRDGIDGATFDATTADNECLPLSLSLFVFLSLSFVRVSASFGDSDLSARALKQHVDTANKRAAGKDEEYEIGRTDAYYLLSQQSV